MEDFVVSTLGLGTMSLLSSNDEAQAIDLVHTAVERGITLIDTADVYGDGAVEPVLGAALAGRRDSVVLATKVGLPMNADTTRARGGSARWIGRLSTTACAGSAPTASTSTAPPTGPGDAHR